MKLSGLDAIARSITVSEALRELGASHCWEILEFLSDRSCTVGEIAEGLELDVSDISRRLARMRNLGWVVYRPQKKHRIYALSSIVRCRNEFGNLVVQIISNDGSGITVRVPVSEPRIPRSRERATVGFELSTKEISASVNL